MAKPLLLVSARGAIPVALTSARWAPGDPIQIYLVFGQLVSLLFGIAMYNFARISVQSQPRDEI